MLKGKAHTLAEDTVVNTDTIPAGYLVVKAQWLRLEQRECEGKLRSYTLLEAETLIIVNHMVRLAGLRFSPGRPCGHVPRTALNDRWATPWWLGSPCSTRLTPTSKGTERVPSPCHDRCGVTVDRRQGPKGPLGRAVPSTTCGSGQLPR